MAIDPNSNAALEISDQVEYMYYMKDAPIMDFMKFAGIDIDEAVKLRVAAALDDYKPKLNVTIREIAPRGNLYGFASVKIGGVTIDDFKILEKKDGELFVGMPSRRDDASKTGYRNTVFVDKDYLDEFNREVLRAYGSMISQAKSWDARAMTEPREPSISARVRAAAIKAGEINDELPRKARNEKPRDGRGE